jgi:hypothetical protein
LRFRLYTGILSVNKQISAESTRVLYHENHFIIFRVSTIHLHLSEIPIFGRLSEDAIKDPILRVEVNIATDRRLLPRYITPGRTTTCITTSDGLQSVIHAIWRLGESGEDFNPDGDQPHHGDINKYLSKI